MRREPVYTWGGRGVIGEERVLEAASIEAADSRGRLSPHELMS